jgi:hypothetical protein
MNMSGMGEGAFGPLEAIVFAAMAFAAVLTLAWSMSPGLRAWIERPKYRFQQNVQIYDEMFRENINERHTPK